MREKIENDERVEMSVARGDNAQAVCETNVYFVNEIVGFAQAAEIHIGSFTATLQKELREQVRADGAENRFLARGEGKMKARHGFESREYWAATCCHTEAHERTECLLNGSLGLDGTFSRFDGYFHFGEGQQRTELIENIDKRERGRAMGYFFLLKRAYAALINIQSCPIRRRAIVRAHGFE